MIPDWVIIVAASFSSPLGSPEGSDAARPSPRLASLEGNVADLVGRFWPRRPEWADMMLAILKDEALEDDKGWWRPSISIYDWAWLRDRYDIDQSGRVEPNELGDARDLCERLDRDDDGSIGEEDFRRVLDEVPQNASLVFRRLDEDGNGRISWDELSSFFQQADRRKRGFITRRELAAALPELSTGGGETSRPEEEGGRDMPSKWKLLFMLFNGQLGSFQEGPALGEKAPDFSLSSLETGKATRLSEARGKRPVVLIFGSFT